MDPEAGPLLGGEEERRHEEDSTEQEQQIAVALQVTGVADHQQGDDVEADADGHPARLGLGIGRVPAGDDDVPDPVEQGGQGQDHGIGLRDQPAVGHVGHQGEAEQYPEEGPDVRGDLRVGSQFSDDVEGHRQQRGEDEKTQLGAALGLGPPHVAGEPGVARGAWHPPDRSGGG